MVWMASLARADFFHMPRHSQGIKMCPVYRGVQPKEVSMIDMNSS